MNNIAIVGSSKLGFSLNPKNLFRSYRENSDIDLIVVDPDLFRETWDAYLAESKKSHIAEYPYITSAIFQRFVTVKDPNIEISFFHDWTIKVDSCKRDLQVVHGIYNDLNYRIYESWEAVETYHVHGLSKVRKKLEAK